MKLALAVWMLVSVPLMAQEASPAKVTFGFDRVGLEVPHYTLTVDEQGHMAYHAELAPPPSPAGTQVGTPAEPSAAYPAIERDLVLSPGTTATIFELARSVDRFTVACDSKAKNLADMGRKRLSYEGTGGAGSCVYNYSELKSITALTDLFLDIETTLEFGRHLDFKRRFDRLGLDAEMTGLGEMIDSHRAIEVQLISPTLRTISNDTELMQRVRLRAARMLDQINQSNH